MKPNTEHLTDEQLLDLIAGADVCEQAGAVEHLADCDYCRARFGDWLKAVTPFQTLHSDLPCLTINLRLIGL